MNPKPNNFSIIPASVRYDKRLCPLDVLIYAEVSACLDKNGECHADRKYFCETFGLEFVKAGESIKRLIDAGHISLNIKGEKKFLKLGTAPTQQKLFSVPKREKKESIDWDALRVQFNEMTGKNSMVVPEKAKQQFRALLKIGTYTKEHIVIVIERASKDQTHVDNNFKNLTLELISRPVIFERYISQKE